MHRLYDIRSLVLPLGPVTLEWSTTEECGTLLGDGWQAKKGSALMKSDAMETIRTPCIGFVPKLPPLIYVVSIPLD